MTRHEIYHTLIKRRYSKPTKWWDDLCTLQKSINIQNERCGYNKNSLEVAAQLVFFQRLPADVHTWNAAFKQK
jgi:hypothetical protein